jgi:hypothetical protein
MTIPIRTNLLLTPPGWLPRAGGRVPAVYADFAKHNYWFAGRQMRNFETWRRLLSGTLDGSSTRYYTNSAGLLVGTTGPRFDYDPSTLAARGLLLEGARTNLCLRSQEFGNAAWTKVSSSITDDARAAPDGTTTADRFVGSGSNALLQTASNITVASSTTYACSIYVERDNFQWLLFGVADSGSYSHFQARFFDLQNKVKGVGTSSGGSAVTLVDYSLTDVGNGRMRLTMLVSTTGTTLLPFFAPVDADGSTTRPNVGSGEGVGVAFFAWGAQLEAGAFPSSYIPTTSGSVTRAADSFSFGDPPPWQNASAGAYFSEFERELNVANSPRLWGAASSNVPAYLTFNSDGTISIYDTNAQSATTANSQGNGTNKAATSYNGGTLAAVLNGGTVATGTQTGAMSGNGAVLVGAGQVTSRPTFSPIRKIAYWNFKPSNAALQALTT